MSASCAVPVASLGADGPAGIRAGTDLFSVISARIEGMEPAAHVRLAAAGITTREAEVLAVIGGWLTNTEIADRLCISVRTVESHVSALLRKLALPGRWSA